MVVEDMFNRYPEVPVKKQQADRDKRTRATAVANRYEAGKVYHLIHLRESDFEIELTSFDRGHDDLVDSLGYSFQMSDRSGLVLRVRTEVTMDNGTELEFRDGRFVIPDYLADLMSEIDTTMYTRQQAIDKVNSGMLRAAPRPSPAAHDLRATSRR